MYNIVFSMGDPNGVGIEVLVKALDRFDKESDINREVKFTLAANPDTLIQYIKAMNLPAEPGSNKLRIGKTEVDILPCSQYSVPEFGLTSGKAGALAAEAVGKALNATIDGTYDALVTMPVSKKALYLAGWRFPGHTEMLADRCGVKKPLMLLCTKSIRVALVTIHSAIKDLTYEITKSRIIHTATVFDHSLKRDFGLERPKIAVLGLNPHAGEQGSIGREDEDIVAPAIQLLKMRGIIADGPHPSDGFFAHGAYKNYDGILAMYHDQGLIPLKILANGGGINFTAGLPIVRTSPDHGTAFAIAGKNIASEKSTTEAIEMAIEVISNRRNSPIA
ncbi:MAG: 4-hydroxythreonine-4-phosphate dehydrogenase PdxA [Candidatus Kapaibacterium sp.]